MRILITGASSGIGAATARALRARGHRVGGIDLIAGASVRRADVRDQGQVDAAVAATAAELGGLDILVNNAGIGEPRDAGLRPDDRVTAILETNFVGAWRVTAAALPHLLQTRGRVVNVASGMAIVTLPLGAAYSASKRALVAYSDTLRAEYGDRITVTTVYPGYVETSIHERSVASGVRLGDAVPQDSMDTVVRTMLRACLGRPRRELATSALTAAGLIAARHLPALADAVVRRRTHRAFPSASRRRSDR
jgi:NAD(P)-dependent dehydrogenase (short-subunit alcohol dehydrogenase family)